MTTDLLRSGLLAIGLVFLTACGVTDHVKRAFAKYEEPVDGPRARVRLISDQPSPYGYSGQSCMGAPKAGAGATPGTGPFGGIEYRTIGMPKIAVEGGRAVTEIYVRAGEPFTFRLVAGGCSKAGCPVDKWSCDATRSFVPADGEDYVATIVRRGQSCPIELYRIAAQGNSYVLVPQVSSAAGDCVK